VKKLLLVLTIIGLVFVGCGSVEQKAQYNYIDAGKTAELMRKDSSKLVLVDIQEKDDFAEEHLKGAGDMKRFNKLYSYLESDLANMGCDTVVTACENCYMSLKELSPHIKVKSLYEVLDSIDLPESTCKGYIQSPKVALHDPCPTRYETVLHVSVRSLMDKLGLKYEEFKNCREKTECCGSGGMLELTNPKLALKQINSRANQTKCDVIVSYCQSCSESMTKGGKYGVHILDLIYFENMKEKMKQKKKGTVKKWFNRYQSKKMIERFI